ncbi:MAG TPA: RluA family pseudouridine synthase [Opitutaceae bacterium]|nr:RluA family pseudouridine synthase [Opitutaceae bacterium]
MPLPPVIFEDDAMIAFDKPSGLLVAPDRWDKARENLMGLVHDKMGHGVANVHRLDADTSGILLCSKTKPALDFLSGQFQGKTVQKKYLALIAGAPTEDAFTIDLPLDDDERRPGKMRVVRKGKPSVTEFQILERFGAFTWIECRPITGRTHQIRVHLATKGWPILNDVFYGNPETKLMLSNLKRGYKGRVDEKPLIQRLALHASELVVKHPVTREPVTIAAPLPKEFEVALKYLRKFSSPRGAHVAPPRR